MSFATGRVYGHLTTKACETRRLVHYVREQIKECGLTGHVRPVRRGFCESVHEVDAQGNADGARRLAEVLWYL